MKQSNGRLFGARLLSRPADLGVGMAVAVVAGISACGGSGGDSCHNVPPATTVVGQPNFNLGNANQGGVSGSTLGGAQGSSAANDGTGPLFIADTSDNRILGYNKIPTGVAAVTYTGANGTGNADFVLGQPDLKTITSGTGPNAAGTTSFGLFQPAKAAIGVVNGAPQYLVVADTGNNRVLIWNSLPAASNVKPDVVVGQPNITSSLGNYPNKTPTASSLLGPTSAFIAGTSSGTAILVVVDKGNNRVLIWNTVPTADNTPADVELGQTATNTAGLACTSNDVTQAAGFCFGTNIPASDTSPQGGTTFVIGMNSPSDAWTDGKNFVISDTGNHRVLYYSQFPTNNVLASTVVGFAQFGQGNQTGSSGQGGLHSPFGVYVDGGGDLFVGDSGNNRVLEFSHFLISAKNGQQANYVWGQQDFTHTQLNDPDQNGQVGDQRNNPATNGITQGTMSSPQGVFADESNLIVSDSGNSRILIYPIVAPDGNINPYGGVDGSDTDDTNFCQ